MFPVFSLPDLGSQAVSDQARHFLARKGHYRHTCCLTWTTSGGLKTTVYHTQMLLNNLCSSGMLLQPQNHLSWCFAPSYNRNEEQTRCALLLLCPLKSFSIKLHKNRFLVARPVSVRHLRSGSALDLQKNCLLKGFGISH